MSKQSRQTSVSRLARPIWAILLVGALGLPLAGLAIYSVADQFSTTSALPTAYSLRWFAGFLHDPRATDAAKTSVELACSATALSLLVGLPAAWGIAVRPGRASTALESLTLLRAGVPVIVLGLGTATLLYRLGAIDTWGAVIAAHTCGALPFVILATRPAFSGIETQHIEAARDLGASWPRVSVLVLRLVAPSIVSGGLFAFLFSLDEFGLTFLIAGVHIVTLPILLYGSIQSSSISAASAIAVVLLIPSVLISGAAVWVIRRTDTLLRGASA